MARQPVGRRRGHRPNPAVHRRRGRPDLAGRASADPLLAGVGPTGGRLRPAAVGRGGLPRLEILTHLGALAVVLVAAAGAGGPARPPINGGESSLGWFRPWYASACPPARTESRRNQLAPARAPDRRGGRHSCRGKTQVVRMGNRSVLVFTCALGAAGRGVGAEQVGEVARWANNERSSRRQVTEAESSRAMKCSPSSVRVPWESSRAMTGPRSSVRRRCWSARGPAR